MLRVWTHTGRSRGKGTGPIGITAIVVAMAIGLAAGAGVFTFVYAKGGSYLTNDPVACANCHVMREQLAGWVAGSHRAVAVCNDCHTPHTSMVAKYANKALNGFWHSFAFTSGRFQEPIQITPRNRAVTEAACRHCHDAIVGAIDPHPASGTLECIRCHGSVGHLQ
jgi:cytochrome c nitrite reductase small subunit